MSTPAKKTAPGWHPLAAAALVSAVVSLAAIGGFLAIWFTSIQPANSGSEKTAALTGAQKKAIETTVRNYLINNPDILIEMSSVLEERQAEAETAALAKAIDENAEAIYRSGKDPVVGNPEGDVTVVEFFDYNCGYCRRAFDHLAKLIETDKNVRVVLKELPIFGKGSEEAARIALAATKQGKYFELHRALLKTPGRADMTKALNEAEKLGLDTERLKRDMNSPEVDAVLAQARKMANELGVNGTPYYLVDDKAIPGAPGNLYELFVEHVAEARKSG